MFQDGSCECPKMNHRRRIRAQSETARRRQTAAPRPYPHSGRTETVCGARLRRAGRVLRRVRDSYIVRFCTTVRQPAGHRHGPAATRERDDWTPERRLCRHRTGRDVLLREKCTPSANVDGRDPCHAVRHLRDASTTSRRDARTPPSDDESLRSFIRVSQVYP